MRENLIELVHNARMNALWHNAKNPSEYIADMLIDSGVTIPVRCKDCKNNGQCSIQDAMNWTPKTEIVDYFCSYGERKDNVH